jgi:glycosyltransferase involved in cell wall biosynthesis
MPLSDKIKIAFLLQDLEFGGTQRYALNLLRRLDRSVFSPELWVMRNGDDMGYLAREAGVEPLFLSKTYWVGPQALTGLAGALIRRRPDLLYTMTVVPNIWGRLFGKLARVPTIISSWRGLYPKQYESLLWRLSAKIICNAQILREIMVTRYGVDPEKIEVIPNGVDAEKYQPKPELRGQKPTVVYLGRLVHDKDPVTLAKGFVSAAQQCPDAEFEIIGNGRLRPQVEALINGHGLADRIRMLPGMPDPRPHLHKAWIFAMSSVREACPNVVLEAMACGIPVVATRVGGIPELVSHGETGLLYEAGDSEGLARCLLDLMQDSKKRQEMGENARRIVLDKFTMEIMIDRTHEIMLEVMGK